MLIPSSEITVTPPSIQVWALRAASRPRGMPTPTAKIIAATVSSIVAGNRIANSVRNGLLLTIEAPKSRRSSRDM